MTIIIGHTSYAPFAPKDNSNRDAYGEQNTGYCDIVYKRSAYGYEGEKKETITAQSFIPLLYKSPSLGRHLRLGLYILAVRGFDSDFQIHLLHVILVVAYAISVKVFVHTLKSLRLLGKDTKNNLT